MYRMSEFEFLQFEEAAARLGDLRKQHASELQEAYDGIHATRMAFDYHLGRVFSESVNPAEYAIYLVEMQEDHAKHEVWWELRANAYREALARLGNEERDCLLKRASSWEELRIQDIIRKTARSFLQEIVGNRPELQRRSAPLDYIDDMDEADLLIDRMSEKELLEDYWDKEELDENAVV